MFLDGKRIDNIHSEVVKDTPNVHRDVSKLFFNIYFIQFQSRD